VSQLPRDSQVGQVITHGILLITLIEGRDLLRTDWIGGADPYCTFSNGRQKVSSRKLTSTVNPNWHREALSLCMENLTHPVKIEVWDVDPVGEDFMGGAELDISKLGLTEKPLDLWIKLSTQGRIHVELAYQFLM